MNLNNPIYDFNSPYQELEPLNGYPGYFVNILNDIISFRQAKRLGHVIAPHRKHLGNGEFGSLSVFLMLDGKRVLRGRKKLLVNSLGEKEFARREANRENRDAFNQKIYKQFVAEHYGSQQEKVAEESRRVRKSLEKPSAGDIEEALGELF